MLSALNRQIHYDVPQRNTFTLRDLRFIRQNLGIARKRVRVGEEEGFQIVMDRVAN
jgi:hypothetical protein